jgi:hypothetical protein
MKNNDSLGEIWSLWSSKGQPSRELNVLQKEPRAPEFGEGRILGLPNRPSRAVELRWNLLGFLREP